MAEGGRDAGSGDTITVSPDGNSWSDTGMNWSGPDIYVNGGAVGYWSTPAVSNYGQARGPGNRRAGRPPVSRGRRRSSPPGERPG
jgi:hypothetical protein